MLINSIHSTMNFNNNTAPAHQKIPINCMKETLLPYKLIYSSPCDSCRKNRIKCDRDPKECAHCKRKGVKCTYLYTRKKRGPKGKLHHLMQQFETTLKSKDEEVSIAQIQTQHIVNNVSSKSNSSISSLLNPEPYYYNQSQYDHKIMCDSPPSYKYNYYNSGNIESGRPTLVPSSSASYYEVEKRSSTFYLPSSSSSSLSHDLANYSTAPHNSRLSPSLSSRINSTNQIEKNSTTNGSDLHFIIPRKNSTINTYSNSLYSEFN